MAGQKPVATDSYSSLLRVIPPEQQAEADELAAALSELQTATMHECQEVVRCDGREYLNFLVLWDLLGEKNVSPYRTLRMTALQSAKPSLQRRLRSWYVRLVFVPGSAQKCWRLTDMMRLRLR